MKISRIALLALPITGLLGCVLGGLLADGILQGAFRDWQLLGTPPGSAQTILDADASIAYVETAQGGITRCPPCTEIVQPLEEPLLDEQFNCSRSLDPPPAPGEVVDRFGGVECYADGGTDFAYVILSDGTVWRWDFTSSAILILIYPILMGMGCLGGFFVGGSITFFVWLFSKKDN